MARRRSMGSGSAAAACMVGRSRRMAAPCAVGAVTECIPRRTAYPSSSCSITWPTRSRPRIRCWPRLLAMPANGPATRPQPGAAPTGAYIEPETGLSVRFEAGSIGKLLVHYDRFPETLTLNPDGTAGTADTVLVRPDGDSFWMDRAADHQSTRLIPQPAVPVRTDISGRYECEELGTELVIIDAGGVLYGAFAGFLGQGRMELLDSVAADVWTLPCPRALDHTPPGNWTLAVNRDADGRTAGITLGCWLARRLDYRLVS